MIDNPQKANVVPIGVSQSKQSVAQQQALEVRAQLARLPAPAHRLREKATTLLQQTLKNLFDGADDALFDLADRATSNHDQNTYFEAMREVRLKRREVEMIFFTKLDQGFVQLLKVIPDQDDVYVAGISLDELSLVDNDQLEFQVAVESMVAKVFESCAEPAQHIALRLDSLLPAKVYQQNNPVGPDRLCNNFWKVIDPLDVDIKAKLVLLKLFDKAVMAQLHKIYAVLNNLLIQQNVLPSLSTRSQKRSVQRAAVAPEGSPVGAAAPADQSGQVLAQLRGLMSSAVSSNPLSEAVASVPVGASTSAAVLPAAELAQVLTTLQQHQHSSENRQVGLLDNQQLLQMIAPVSQAGKAMSSMDQDVMNLINMLFQFILDDRNLAPAMQSILARLQIPLLKVAVIDKSFFNKAGHPARRLLNELATAALGWQEPEAGAPKDPLFRKVSETVDTVISEFENDVTMFETLLTEFIAFTEKEQRRANVLERRTLDAEDGKAKSEQARAEVSRAIESIVQAKALPSCVQQIIEGPWHNVLFLNLLKYGQTSDEWRDSCQVVEQIVWSVTTEFDADDRSKLMSLLPLLLPRLREGFETISYNPFEMNKLLTELEQEHLRLLRAPQKTVEAEAKKPAVKPVEFSTKDAVVETPDGVEDVLSTAPHVTSDLTEAEVDPLDAAVTVNEAVRDHQQRPMAQESSVKEVSASWLEQVDRFAQGSWFEVSEQNKPRYRCRLAAVIKAVDKYIFVNRNGMKVAEKTRQELALSLQQGHFNILDDGMLFDRALESVIGNLRQSRSGIS